jgi:hypothetical protein
VVNARELEGLEKVLIYGNGTAAAGATATPSRTTGAYTELKGYVNYSLRFWGGVAETNYNLLKGGATFGIAVAARVLKSEGKTNSQSKQSENGTTEQTEQSEDKKGTYGHLKEPKNVGEGKKTTPAQRKRILEENKKQNDGELTSDGDGRKLNPPKKNEKGESADMNQAEIDHVNARSKGGSNSNNNLRVLSKEENLKKGNR